MRMYAETRSNNVADDNRWQTEPLLLTTEMVPP